MGNSLRCCISCMLPCGALDVVRIVHANGHVEEINRTVKAEEVMKANPKHVLRKSSCQGIVHSIVILPPDAQLEKGHIYFLIPTSCVRKSKQQKSPNNIIREAPTKISKRKNTKKEEPPPPPPPQQSQVSSSIAASKPPSCSETTTHSSRRSHHNQTRHGHRHSVRIKQGTQVAELVISEQYLADVLTEKAQHEPNRSGGRHSRKNSRVGVWRPHLESISEVSSL